MDGQVNPAEPMPGLGAGRRGPRGPWGRAPAQRLTWWHDGTSACGPAGTSPGSQGHGAGQGMIVRPASAQTGPRAGRAVSVLTRAPCSPGRWGPGGAQRGETTPTGAELAAKAQPRRKEVSFVQRVPLEDTTAFGRHGQTKGERRPEHLDRGSLSPAHVGSQDPRAGDGAPRSCCPRPVHHLPALLQA